MGPSKLTCRIYTASRAFSFIHRNRITISKPSLSTMPTGRRKLLLSTFAVNIGCGGSCTRPRRSPVYHPKPRRPSRNSSSSTSSAATATTSNSYYSDSEYEVRSSISVRGLGKTGGESVAVEKDSDDPYLDFRRSMLQMILEKEIYSKDDLRELLECFLRLNSPCHHGIIVRAFMEIWNGVYSVRSRDV